MKFRLFILKDPEAQRRGYSLKGIKVPLRTFCPVNVEEDLLALDNKPVKKGLYPSVWKIPTDDLIAARPALAPFLRKIDFLMLPTAWCDVAPVTRWEDAWGG